MSPVEDLQGLTFISPNMGRIPSLQDIPRSIRIIVRIMLLRTIILIIPLTPLAFQATLHLSPDSSDGTDFEFVGGFGADGDDLADDLVARADPVVFQRTPASGDSVHVRAADCEMRYDTLHYRTREEWESATDLRPVTTSYRKT
jgi:hypothetical protein